jgi:probable HAF family extracellular repeat protein
MTPTTPPPSISVPATPTPGAANPAGCGSRLFARGLTLTEPDAGSVTARVEVVRSRPSEPEASVTVRASSGTAAAGVDYAAFTNQLVFPAGIGTQVVEVVVAGDLAVEPVETITLLFTNAVAADLVTTQVTVYVLDNDLPRVSARDAAVNEGDGGTTIAVIPVQLSAPPTNTVSLQGFTSNGTAVAGSDYTALTGTSIVFTVGVTQHLVRVAVLADNDPEGTETFFLHLQAISNAVLDRTPATCTIVDDDVTVTPPEMWISDVTVLEGHAGATQAVFTVTLSTSSVLAVSVTYATADLTAGAPADYTALPATALSFTPGVTSRTVSVEVQGDLVSEPTQTFRVVLSAPVNATLVDAQGVGTIVDDDPLALTCPGDVFLVVTGEAGAIVTFDATLSSNECGATASLDPPSGSYFPLGTNSVAATAAGSCWTPVTCSFAVVVQAAAEACPYAYTVTDLGALGGSNSIGLGMNDRGEVVGSYYDTNGQRRAFHWQQGVMTDPGLLPGGLYAYAEDINNQGQIAGTSDATGTVDGLSIDDHAFTYAAGNFTDLGTLGGKSSVAHGQNSAGDVVGWSFRRFQTYNINPFLRTKDTNINLQLFCGVDDPGEAYDVNDHTQVVGFAVACGPFYGYRPFVWQDFAGDLADSPADMIHLGTFGGNNGVGRAINNRGQIAGGADVVTSPTTIRHAFLVTPLETATGRIWYVDANADQINDLMQDLGALPGHTYAEGWDLNDAGDAVGFSYSNGVYVATLWTNGTLRRLDDLVDPAAGWTFQQARAINNSGQITGMGTISNQIRGFLLTPCAPPDGDLRILHLLPAAYDAQSFALVWRGTGTGLQYVVEGSTGLGQQAWTPVAPTGQWPTFGTYWPGTAGTSPVQALRIRAEPSAP